MDKIAVLIPCYNESKTIKKVVEDYKRILPEATIYVYDNNSSDGTDEIARKAGAVVRYEYQQGKGNVIRRMFREIDAECYIMTDGDDTYPVEPTPDMAKMVLEQGVDMVVGDRLSSTYFTENKRPFHNFGNSLVRKSINSLFKSDVKDIMTGLRAFSYGFVKTFPVISKGFEIETEMTIHAIDKNMFIKNVVVDYRDRVEGSVSKLNTFSDGFKVIKTIIRLFKDYKPLRFFTTIALVLFVLALIFFVPVMGTYVNTGLVPNFPTLIVCGFVVIAALQCFFTGLTLSTIVAKNRQDFEFKRITVEEDLKDKLRSATIRSDKTREKELQTSISSLDQFASEMVRNKDKTLDLSLSHFEFKEMQYIKKKFTDELRRIGFTVLAPKKLQLALFKYFNPIFYHDYLISDTLEDNIGLQ